MCTKIEIKTKNENVIVARTGEFEAYCNTEVMYMPRGTEFNRFVNKPELGVMISKSNIIGTITPFLSGETLLDGMNEYGLVFNTHWFSQVTKYKLWNESESKDKIDFTVLPTILLSECKDIDEVKEFIKENKSLIGDLENGMQMPYNHSMTDSLGNSIVIECIDGEVSVTDNNKYKVLTNTPSLKKHIENADKFFKSSSNVDPKENIEDGLNIISNISTKNLPGGFDSQSRFIRASYILKNIDKASTDEEGINLCFRILHTSDVIKGMALTDVGTDDVPFREHVIWSDKLDKHIAYHTDVVIVSDTRNLKYYWTTYNNLTPRFIDMKKLIEKNAMKFSIKKSDDGSKEFFEIKP